MTGKEFKRLRVKLKISQLGAAVLLGLGTNCQGTISRWEIDFYPIDRSAAKLMKRIATVPAVAKSMGLPEIAKRYPLMPRGRVPRAA